MRQRRGMRASSRRPGSRWDLDHSSRLDPAAKIRLASPCVFKVIETVWLDYQGRNVVGSTRGYQERWFDTMTQK